MTIPITQLMPFGIPGRRYSSFDATVITYEETGIADLILNGSGEGLIAAFIEDFIAFIGHETMIIEAPEESLETRASNESLIIRTAK